MKNELIDFLNQILLKINLNISAQQQTLLVEYVIMLHHWNKAYNLTSIRDPKQMLIKHIIDSIVISPYLKGDYFIDVGTGPGLPGIPLAIINPNKTFYLLDSLGKRIIFLKQVIYQLKLTNTIAVKSRVEMFTSPINLDKLEVNKKFDGVLSRAFSELNQFVEKTDHLLDNNGLFYALKGIYNEQEINNLSASYQIETIENLDVPFLDGERHLICVKKII